MTPAISVLIYVQHLLGIGHLKRAAALARGLAEAGFRVSVASGGMPVPGISVGDATLIQLPPLRAADSRFSALVDDIGEPASTVIFAARRIRLIEAVEAAAPDIVITEHFPFGRRKLRDEILTLLQVCRKRRRRPWIMASVRDILVAPRDPAQCVDWIEAYYDAILVHGDPGIMPFEASFSLWPSIARKVHYTGYVTEPLPDPVPDGERFEILVSAGGGTEAESLIETALAARPLSSARRCPWRVLLGASTPDCSFDRLRALSAPGVAIERFRPDVPQLLAQCRLSISRAGYNTMAETVGSRARSIVVPFETERETEQVQRAAHFAAKGLCHLVRQADLTPQRLATTIDAALAGPTPGAANLRLDGVRTTAFLLSEWISPTGWTREAWGA